MSRRRNGLPPGFSFSLSRTVWLATQKAKLPEILASL